MENVHAYLEPKKLKVKKKEDTTSQLRNWQRLQN